MSDQRDAQVAQAIKRALAMTDAEAGPACMHLRVPATIDMSDEFREAYSQGYRHAIADVRKASALRVLASPQEEKDSHAALAVDVNDTTAVRQREKKGQVMSADRPLAIDLYCGLGGWTEGLLEEGFRVVGFDIERHVYPSRRGMPSDGLKVPGNNSAIKWSDRTIARLKDAHVQSEEASGWECYPGQLVIQDVLTLHGRQFKDAALIVASPPCQEFSYMAMPWSKAKAKQRDYETGVRDVKQLTALFDACFRIQREASEAAGHHIPLVVENVRGAQKWVGRARWHFGSFYLWGDVPALMPMTRRHIKMGRAPVSPNGTTRRLTNPAEWRDGDTKNTGGSWFNVAHNTTSGHSQNPVNGFKQPGISGPRVNGKGDAWFQDGAARHGSKSPARKAASAMIAKIPLVLSRHIANVYKPSERVA